MVGVEVFMAGGARGAAVTSVSESEGTHSVRAVDGEGGGIPPENESLRFFGDASFLGMRFGETQLSTWIIVK